MVKPNDINFKTEMPLEEKQTQGEVEGVVGGNYTTDRGHGPFEPI